MSYALDIFEGLDFIGMLLQSLALIMEATSTELHRLHRTILSFCYLRRTKYVLVISYAKKKKNQRDVLDIRTVTREKLYITMLRCFPEIWKEKQFGPTLPQKAIAFDYWRTCFLVIIWMGISNI